MIRIMILGIGVGLGIGMFTTVNYPTEYSFYITIALLAALDSMLGAVRASVERTYNDWVFISGLLTNALLAGLLTYLGDLLGVPLYYAAIFTFGGRLFQNMAVIRRRLLERYILKKHEINIEK